MYFESFILISLVTFPCLVLMVPNAEFSYGKIIRGEKKYADGTNKISNKFNNDILPILSINFAIIF